MPDQPDHSTSRDFAYYPAQLQERYEAERAAHARGGLATPDPASGLDPSMSYMAFNGHPHPDPRSATSTHFPSYDFNHAGPWDWNNSVGFSEFGNQYEPQGELVQEVQNQGVANDFSIPLPVPTQDSAYRSPLPSPAVALAPSQNPLSPPPKPPQKPSIQTGMKRKAGSEPNSAISQTASSSTETPLKPAKRPNKSRTSSDASATSPTVAVAATSDARPSQATASASAPQDTDTAQQPKTDNEGQKRREHTRGTGPQGRSIDLTKVRKIAESPGADILPAGKVFPIQIGSELFRLSGASLSSDAPSYFSHFFGEQIHSNQGRAGDIRTLYIDRDPDTFRDIALHLQGYHVNPRDGEHFVRLFADAQFYSLPRLTKQLFSTDIFVRIGGVPFQIPRDLFSSPGDSPNYFSLGFAQFFSTPTEVFPGLDRNALLRPPSINPPSVPNRNGETFGELVRILQGYNVDIRNEAHRSQLLRDARYFHLKGLEQKLIPCDISYNIKRGHSEILVRLDDIRQSGLSFAPDRLSSSTSALASPAAASVAAQSPDPGSKQSSPAPSSLAAAPHARPGTVCYARPFTDDHAATNVLVLEVSSTESTLLHFPIDAPKPASTREPLSLNLRATFHGSTLARITSLFSVVASKMGMPATQPLGLMLLQSGGGVAAQPVSPANSGVSDRRVRVRIPADCYLELDNGAAELAVDPASGRVGIRHVHAATQRKVAGEGEHAADNADSQEWIWGGAKDVDVHIGKDGEEAGEELVVKRAQWRLRVEPVEGESKMQVVLCGVKLEGFSQEKSRNRSRGFLA